MSTSGCKAKVCAIGPGADDTSFFISKIDVQSFTKQMLQDSRCVMQRKDSSILGVLYWCSERTTVLKQLLYLLIERRNCNMVRLD
mmetsp:Transcript_26629/g.39562  ORF Transcript_26629/g.39562 Transcript_26629/m.39562 type:complete len:85 (-) Transcript_26629:56-310(-)